MATPTPLWMIDPDSEEATCQGCSHQAIEHTMVLGPDDEVSYPCGAEERFDVDSQGRMILVEEPCICEGFENN